MKNWYEISQSFRKSCSSVILGLPYGEAQLVLHKPIKLVSAEHCRSLPSERVVHPLVRLCLYDADDANKTKLKDCWERVTAEEITQGGTNHFIEKKQQRQDG